MQMPITMYKVILIGPSQVGKTSIVSSFVSDICLAQYRPTIGIDFSVKMITFDGNVAKLQIWDSAGKQSYKTNITHFLSSAHILMFIFDLTSQDSFCQIKKQILKVYEQLKESNQHCTAVLVGNKLDKVEERQVGYEQANQFGKHVGRYMEVSALTKMNLQELFIQAARDKSSFDTQADSSVKNFSQRMRQFTGQNPIQQLKQIGQLSLEQTTEKPAFDPYNLLLKKHSQTESVAPKVSSLNFKYNIKKVDNFQDENINPIVIKVAIVGEEAVGKTNIINVYAKSQFNEKHLNTFGVDYTFKKIKIDDKYYILQLCDTAGREAYKTITSVLYKNLKIALVVYDKTNIASFDAVRKHINELRQISPDVYVCIVANKKDQQAVVSTEQGVKIAEQLKTDFIEVSTSKFENIDDIFSKALNHALQNKLI